MGKRTAHEALSTPSSFSSSSSSSKHWMYDVFLSFRGEDTGKNFTGHLYMALKEAGIIAFIDDNEVARGEDITAELVRAIKDSRISVVVFSRGYADSSWCLEELVKIMECRTKLGQLVIPIFYDVDPSDVRKQNGTLAQAFEKLEERYWLDLDKVAKWRAALVEAANLSSWVLKDTEHGNEAKFIRKLIEEISRQLLTHNTNSRVVDHEVGLNSRVQDLSCHLGIGSDDVRLVGILGMGGVGKTTLARAIYSEFYDYFEGKSFLSKVRESAKQPNGLEHLQEQLLSDLLQRTKIKVGNVHQGTDVIQKRLVCRKVLVIVDDVDHLDQMNALAMKRDSFGPGSRIIITTRNEHLLKQAEVDTIYRAQEMDEEEALELFSWHAFKNCCPNDKYIELSECVVAHCGGLPLALKVLGSFLFKRERDDWKNTLEKLKRIPMGEIQEQLKISFDGLNDDNERDIFLDISCFFIGMDKNYVKLILNGCGLFANIGISVLLERCLITVSKGNKLMMHDLVRDMGREIVRARSPNNLRRRCRLWHPEDVTTVLTDESGTEEIEGLALTSNIFDKACFNAQAFSNLGGLRLLQLNYIQIAGDYKHVSKNLRWLSWHGFPSEYIPNEFNQQNIVAMDMQYSSLIQVWKDSKQLLEKLKILNLSHSMYLTESPDFSKLPNLEQLILKDCESLLMVHKSVGDLKRLTMLDLEDCKVLSHLPRSFYNLTSLETLVLSGCVQFRKLSKDLGKMVSLTSMVLDYTAITNIPSSIVQLKELTYLSLCGLRRQSSPNSSPACFWSLQYQPSLLPRSLRGLHSLRTLSLRDCKLVGSVPEDLGSLHSLEQLDLGGSSFLRLPSLTGLSNLQYLGLDKCKLTDESIGPMDIGSLSSLLALNLEENRIHSLPSLNGLSKLDGLFLNGCKKLHEMPDLPTSLTQLEANGCVALKRMPNFSKMSNMKRLHLKDALNLIEFPGLDIESLICMRLIHMQGCTNITSTVKDSILKGWNASGNGGVFLPGNDIPEWFTYATNGDTLYFEVPDEMVVSTLKALTVCVVYSCCPEDILIAHELISISIINHTKHTIFFVEPSSPYKRSWPEVIWQGHLSNRLFNMEGGNFIQVYVTIGSDIRVMKVGVNLVTDRVINEYALPCLSIPYEPFIITNVDNGTEDMAGPSHALLSEEDDGGDDHLMT